MSNRIEQAYEITMNQLRSWDPDLREDCSNLDLNTAYCVSGPALGSTPSPTPTTGPVSPPGQSQSGIDAKCNKYVLQKTGIFCAAMATTAGISLDNLYAWNPALGKDCSGLWEGYAHCIGVSS